MLGVCGGGKENGPGGVSEPTVLYCHRGSDRGDGSSQELPIVSASTALRYLKFLVPQIPGKTAKPSC
jgi:hypothetical protein